MTDDVRDKADAARNSVTAAQKAEWDKERSDLSPNDVWYSGFWLYGKLRAAGCDPDLAERIGFAAGQRQAHETTATGIWSHAVTALENYTEHGIWDAPGSALAKKLLFENFGNPLDVGKLLAWLMSRPTGRKELAEIIAEMQATGKLPEEPKTPWDK